MIRLAVCFCLIAIAGCSEIIQGPRYVPIHDNRFYYRAALTADPSFVDRLAAARCEGSGQRAERVDEMQVFPGDLRYVTYRCVTG